MKYAYLTASLACWISVIQGKSTTNLAIKRPAWQSTTFQDDAKYHANKSVDGNKETDIDEGGCSRTKSEANPWWIVALRRQYCISKVAITWEKSNSSTQNGLFLAVGTEFNGKLFQQKTFYQCVKIWGTTDGGTQTFDCSGIEGSFVSLYKSANDTYIEMCEVEVFGYKGICAVNLALNRPVRQTSADLQFWEQVASNAVDGKKDTDILKGSCAQTVYTSVRSVAWWAVFLDQEYHITKITMTWLKNYVYWWTDPEIWIGCSFEGLKFEKKDFVVCGTLLNLPVNNAPYSNFNCQEKKGSSVLVYQPVRFRDRIVQTCEVEVFGFKAPEQTIQNGRIYQFNHEALLHSEAARKCGNRKRTLMSRVHVEQRDIKPYVSAQMARLGLKQSWINTTGTQCYIFDKGAISIAACDDRYGYVCISEPIEPFVVSLRRYSIYVTKVNFTYAQETCNSNHQTIIKQSDISHTRRKLKKHGIERVWIVPEKSPFNIWIGQCVEYNISSDSGPIYSNCADTFAFVCGEGRIEHCTTNGIGSIILVTGTILTGTVIVIVVQCVIIWKMRNRCKQYHNHDLKLPGKINGDETQDGLKDKRTFESTTSRDPNADTTAYYNISDVQQITSTKGDETYTHLELKNGADLEAKTQYEQLKY